jgi:hypothetical protein
VREEIPAAQNSRFFSRFAQKMGCFAPQVLGRFALVDGSDERLLWGRMRTVVHAECRVSVLLHPLQIFTLRSRFVIGFANYISDYRAHNFMNVGVIRFRPCFIGAPTRSAFIF